MIHFRYHQFYICQQQQDKHYHQIDAMHVEEKLSRRCHGVIPHMMKPSTDMFLPTNPVSPSPGNHFIDHFDVAAPYQSSGVVLQDLLVAEHCPILPRPPFMPASQSAKREASWSSLLQRMSVLPSPRPTQEASSSALGAYLGTWTRQGNSQCEDNQGFL